MSAVASRTQEPEWAMEVMRLLRVPTGGYTKEQPMPLYSYFDVFEVYPSDKQAHFRSIAKKTGVPLHSMLFFDDEKRNIVSVGKLGVTCYHVAQTGVTLDNFRAGLKEFSQSRKSSSNMTSWLKAGAAK
ncbi:Magnesium-dependent phosphatase 1 [Gaertneriomyces sp. JEL0708]|nr:Magnesium-dependent phosphatase 1 [Gaertneriomyces sp. JEL0708]